MQTHCNPQQLSFQGLGNRRVEADFDGGEITSDAGALLLREVSEGARILERFAECFHDYRNPSLIEHSVLELVSQRTYAIALGYEDVNDHDELRSDHLLATLVGKTDPTGESRRRERDQGNALAGKSTMNRLELAKPADGGAHRYHKIVYDRDAIESLFVKLFLEAYPTPPEEIVLDLDATDDPLHGDQEGKFFHGYYGHYCYLPLYIFCGEHLLLARLRPSGIDAYTGSIEELQRIVAQIRQRWPDVRIIVRGDSGFARDDLMTWCEDAGVDYVFGLAKNARLIGKIEKQLERSRRRYLITKKASRRFHDFQYKTLNSWTRSRRVVGKAEHLPGRANPRFVVTTLSRKEYGARALYEDLYCARGDMENRIKEQQLGLFADRTGSATFNANQLRLLFSSTAYILTSELRRCGLRGTELEKAQCSTIRTKLFKIGALVTVTVRRVYLRLASGCPYKDLMVTVLANLRNAWQPVLV